MKKNTSHFSPQTSNLRIGWLYPKLMSTYGDRGNILVLQKRCEWRDIEVEIVPIDEGTSDKTINTIDLLFGGGAQDREQTIVMEHLQRHASVIKKRIEKNMPALFVCGAPQLMGDYYETADGQRIEGLGIFPMHTKPADDTQDRLIGNVVAKINPEGMKNFQSSSLNSLVGFENHGGRTYLDKGAKTLATILKGNGNNGEDGSEGVVYKNALGTYLHGPLLPKNPEIADWLISTALEIKYGKKVDLKPLDDNLEKQAKSAIANRLGIEV